MALIITDSIHTNKGITNELYINIQRISVPKPSDNPYNKSIVSLGIYKTADARFADPHDVALTLDIAKNYHLLLSVEDLASNDIYAVLYGKLTTLLQDKGYTVENHP